MTEADSSAGGAGGEVTANVIGPGFVGRLADHAVLVELDGEAVIYDERTSALHVLNPTATLIASCLDGSSNLDQLVRELADTFSTEQDTVNVQVLELVRSLGRQGLLDGVGVDPVVAGETLPPSVDRRL